MNHWFLAGSNRRDYEIGSDDTVTYDGKRSAFIKSLVPRPGGFGTLMQVFKANAYRGKRVRLSAALKAQGVGSWAGLWMRLDGQGKSLVLDNMQQRPITGTTDWQQYEVVLDVPEESTQLAFGVLLHGGGQVWLSDVRFEAVDESVAVTAQRQQDHADHPRNLDFADA